MSRYHVQRSTQINASADKVFQTVADFGTWTSWSPWLAAEPDAQVTVSQDPSSVGSSYCWKGQLVGEGELEHRSLQPNRLIEDEIRFIKPFRSKSQVAFEIEAVGEGAKITWHMRGSLPWFLFWMRSQMEVFIGMDYERGLKMLKEFVETGRVLSETTIRGIESVGPLRMVGVRKMCPMSEIGPFMEASLKQVQETLSKQNIAKGQPIGVYHAFDMKARIFDCTSGYVIPEASAAAPAGLSSWSIPATQALAVEHRGSYDNLGNAWSAANQVARYQKLKQSKAGAFEIYKNDPHETQCADLRTEIFLPLK